MSSNGEHPPTVGAGASTSEAEIAALREKYELLQQIQALDSRMTLPSGAKPAMRVRVPEGTYNMSPTEYRTYVKDCKSYHQLTQMTDHDVVLQLRLNMDSDLKRIVDKNYPLFELKNIDEALEIIGTIVHEESNPAVYRHQFIQMIQGKDEPIKEFVT